MSLHSKCTVFSLYVYWGGLGVGGAIEDYGGSKASKILQKDSKTYLEV